MNKHESQLYDIYSELKTAYYLMMQEHAEKEYSSVFLQSDDIAALSALGEAVNKAREAHQAMQRAARKLATIAE